MRLILIRHGKAEADAPSGRDDDRILRVRGENQAAHLGEWLSGLPDRPRVIFSSGVVRAVQTARILQRTVRCTVQLEPGLETGEPASAAMALIERRLSGESGGEGPLVFVGHNPQLEEVTAVLTRGVASAGPQIRTGEAVVLDVPDEPGEIVGRCTLVESVRLEGE